MPISGLVLTFAPDREQRLTALRLLETQPSIELGVCEGHRGAIVIDSPSAAEDKKLFQWVQDLPGVDDVQVAFVGFDESESPSEPPPPTHPSGPSA